MPNSKKFQVWAIQSNSKNLPSQCLPLADAVSPRCAWYVTKKTRCLPPSKQKRGKGKLAPCCCLYQQIGVKQIHIIITAALLLNNLRIISTEERIVWHITLLHCLPQCASSKLVHGMDYKTKKY